MVQREAAFLISRATEEFIQRIAEAAQQVAERERRSTVQAKDLGECFESGHPQILLTMRRCSVASVRRADEFAFLEGMYVLYLMSSGTPISTPELLPYLEPEPAAPGRSKARTKDGSERGKLTGQSTMLDQFVKKPTKDGSPDEQDGGAPQTRVLTHEDGTMEVVPVEAPP